MRNFRNLTIWQQGIELVMQAYKLAETLPNTEKYGLKSQICRAAVSIVSNISEGCSRNSDIEYKRFLEMSLGSAFELETQLIIIQKLNFAESILLINIFEALATEQKMINNLISKIKEDNINPKAKG